MNSIIVYNPYSGNGLFAKKLPKVKSFLADNNISLLDVFASTHIYSISEYIFKIASEKIIDVIIIAGGDGTLNDAIQGIMKLHYQPKICYIPSGTVNDVGGILGLKKNWKKSLNLIIEDNHKKMDIGKLNDKYFAYVGACGKFTAVSYDPSKPKIKKRIGKLYYMFKAMKELSKDSTMNLCIKTESEVYEGQYYLMLCINAQRVGGFRYPLRTKAKLNDGVMEMILFDKQRFFSIFNMIKFFLFGDLIKGGFKVIRGNDFEITSNEPITYNVDGEKVPSLSDVKIRVITQAIDIYASKKKIHKLFN